jgi:hypothetical protein
MSRRTHTLTTQLSSYIKNAPALSRIVGGKQEPLNEIFSQALHPGTSQMTQEPSNFTDDKDANLGSLT